MAAEIGDDVAASSPLAALTMTKETSKTGRACLFIFVACLKVKRRQKASFTFGFRTSKFGRVLKKCERLLKETVMYRACRGKPNYKPINYVGNS